MELLEMHGITKRFPGVLANDGVNLSVRDGEIHALLGENGAGKTTLMNILYGLYSADAGEIYFGGKNVNISSPGQAIKLGIGMVHQHFMLVSPMTVLENVLLGLKDEGYPLFSRKCIADKVQTLADRYGLALKLDSRVEDLSVGEQQRIEILKALYRGAKLLILDEPTSVLTPQETEDFFVILRTLKQEGHGIILIAHKLSEILAISDRVTIMRDGRSVSTLITTETDAASLSRHMIGREMYADAPFERNMPPEYHKDPLLRAENLTYRDEEGITRLNNLSLELYPGEVLGIAGVDGNGQKELAECVTGLLWECGGSVSLRGVPIGKKAPRARAEAGIAYIPADRHRDGLIMNGDVSENLHLKDYYKPSFAKGPMLDFGAMRASSERDVETYDIKTPGVNQTVRFLSGGNQQKLILARELDEHAVVTVACQPTRGLDIGATRYLREQLMGCRNRGGGVLLISTDLAEILAMSDRIAVLHNGEIMGIVDNDQNLTAEEIGLMMGGERRQA